MFSMRLMVIDICIDETLLFLGQFVLKTVISGQRSEALFPDSLTLR
ncbi:MAG: hypothetical protein LVS60_10235 [Nodosilinea sp. LVE1205-7]